MTQSEAVAVSEIESETTATMVRQIAHELRQPLSTIESIAYYLDLILPRDDARARVQLERLQKLVDQSNWIVSNAVHYVQASPPIPQSLDLREVVGSVASDAAMGSMLEFDLVESPLVRLDPGQAIHLFGNLLAFFRNLSSQEQPVRVSTRTSGRDVFVEFFSPVPGLSLRELHSMFEPFSPGLPAGSGLSLASVRRIVEAHEGRVDAKADPNSGVSITLVIPD